jgi:hypothetical protein
VKKILYKTERWVFTKLGSVESLEKAKEYLKSYQQRNKEITVHIFGNPLKHPCPLSRKIGNKYICEHIQECSLPREHRKRTLEDEWNFVRVEQSLKEVESNTAYITDKEFKGYVYVVGYIVPVAEPLSYLLEESFVFPSRPMEEPLFYCHVMKDIIWQRFRGLF